MSARHALDAFAAALLAGATFGAMDAFLGLVANPDPGSASYVLGLICGPVLLGTAWATLVGVSAAGTLGCSTRARRDPSRDAARSVAAVWLVGIAGDLLGSERSWPEVVLVLLAAAGAAAAGAAFASRAAHALAATSVARRRTGWTIVVASLVALALVALPSGDLAFRPDDPACAASQADASGRPNVLLVSVDTLRADVARTMRSYRRLADSGIEFTGYVTPSPWTLPSIASLLTGVSPDAHGAGESASSRSVIVKTPVRDDVPRLAQRLRDAGYRTQAIVTNPFLTPAYGIDRGFCGFRNLSMQTEAVRGLGTSTLVRLLRHAVPRLVPSDRADVVRAATEAWLASRPPQPFFLWVHFLDPHAPYGDRDGVSTSLTLDLRTFHTRRAFEEPFGAMALLRSGEYRPTADERARIVGLYRADVAFVDEQLGRLLDFVAARGLLANTVVVLVSDHGEEFWDHGGVEHGHSLHEEVVHVPLVLSLPAGVAPSRRDDRLATAIDVAPTLARLAGLRDAWPGEDLLSPPPHGARSVALGRLLFGEEWTGVRTRTTKYLRAAHGSEQMFDLVGDPGELHDRSAADAALLAQLRSASPAPPSGWSGVLAGAAGDDGAQSGVLARVERPR